MLIQPIKIVSRHTLKPFLSSLLISFGRAVAAFLGPYGVVTLTLTQYICYPVRLPEISEPEKQLIQGTADFFALNMYTAFLVEHKEFPADVEWNYLTDQEMKTTSHPSWRQGISMCPCFLTH